jgi:FRG domain
MEIIGKQKVWSFFKESNKAKPGTCSAVRKSEANEVRSFMDLATKVAELQFMNRDYVLLFRGQRSDYKNVKGNTSLKPSLFRGTTGKNPNREQIVARFAVLQKAERLLIEKYSSEQLQGRQRLQRQRILRWSILQHYEVCETPLLDVSHSLRVAASFASIGANPYGQKIESIERTGISASPT